MKEYFNKLTKPEKILTCIGILAIALGSVVAFTDIPNVSTSKEILAVIALESSAALGILKPYVNSSHRSLR